MDAVNRLIKELEEDVIRRKEQAAKGFDAFTYFMFKTLREYSIPESEKISENIKTAFVNNPNWLHSEKEYRELRKKITFTIYSQEEDLDKVALIVDRIFNILEKADELK